MKAVRRTSVFTALIAIFVQLFIPASMAIAASMTNIKVADWRNTWHLHLFNGLHWTDTGMWMKRWTARLPSVWSTASISI